MLSGFIVIKNFANLNISGKKMKIQREKVGSDINKVCNVIQECAREYVKVVQTATLINGWNHSKDYNGGKSYVGALIS